MFAFSTVKRVYNSPSLFASKHLSTQTIYKSCISHSVATCTCKTRMNQKYHSQDFSPYCTLCEGCCCNVETISKQDSDV